MGVAHGQLAQPGYHPSRILVKPSSTFIRNLHADLGTRVLRTYSRFGGLQVVEIPAGASVEDFVARFQGSGLVEYAELDYVHTLTAPNDALYATYQ
jgi:hypothetical protein